MDNCDPKQTDMRREWYDTSVLLIHSFCSLNSPNKPQCVWNYDTKHRPSIFSHCQLLTFSIRFATWLSCIRHLLLCYSTDLILPPPHPSSIFYLCVLRKKLIMFLIRAVFQFCWKWMSLKEKAEKETENIWGPIRKKKKTRGGRKLVWLLPGSMDGTF